MRIARLVSLLGLLAFAFGLGAPVDALEIRSRKPASEGIDREWNAGVTIHLQYYNLTCTGWLLSAGPFAPNDRVGVQFDSPVSSAKLVGSWVYFDEGAPAGYGYTGTIEVHDADAEDCPSGAPLASLPLAPVRNWNYFAWPSVEVGESFTVSLLAPATGAPWYVWFNDSFCPPPPEPHSFVWTSGTGEEQCPGVVINDYELVLDAQLTIPTDIGERSWSRVKNLFK